MPLIKIRNLAKRYHMGDSVVKALNGVDLDIERGEFVAIIGPSGSGKSTMMHLLGCLDRPSDGTYEFNGRDVGELNDRDLAVVRNDEIGFVFQTFNLINRTSALVNVGVPLFYARQTDTTTKARVALERVGLRERARHKPSELSGGERQRVAIARAIVNDPLLLLADEPTGNLDTRTGEQIMEIFHSLNRQGVTIIIVTHEPDIAMQARRIVAMRDGRIVSDDTVEEYAARIGLQPDARGGRPPAAQAEPDAQPQHSGQVRPGRRLASSAALADSAPDSAECADAPARPRWANGTTTALVFGAVGPLLFGTLWLAAYLLVRSQGPVDPERLKSGVIATPLIVAVLIRLGALIAAIALGTIAIVWGRRALRCVRHEPGRWLGAGRARLGVALGIVTIALPVVPFLFAWARRWVA